ncbi:WD repeat-containing protein 31-like [Glandiceps talaboti]
MHSDHVNTVDKVGPGICISGSADTTLVQYDWKNGQLQYKWTGHSRDITKVVHSSKLNAVFSASRDKSVCMWGYGSSDQPVRQYQGHELVVTGLTLNTENNQLCTGSRDNYIKVWDIETGSCILQNHISRNLVTCVKWLPNQDAIAQTSEDKCLRIWDSRTLRESHVFQKKQYIQTCCDVSCDGYYCVTSSNGFGGQGCEATLWDLRQNRAVCEYRGHSQTTACCIFVPSLPSITGPLIATSSHDCTVKIWRQDTQECLSNLALDGAGPLNSLTAYEDGSICCASFNTGVHVMSLLASQAGGCTLREKKKY